LVTYLAPSLPEELFRLVGEAIAESFETEVWLRVEPRISGPLPGDENPFDDETAEIGFVCAPTFRWLHDRLELLPVPVPVDARAQGEAVYFADVVVRADSVVRSFEDLRGRRWAFNDRNSRSGWFSMLERVSPAPADGFFSELIHAGSHLESLALIASGRADAAAIDSNVLRLQRLRGEGPAESLRVLESWGPFPIQPVVMRSGVPRSTRDAVRRALLQMHETHGDDLAAFGVCRFVDVDRSSYFRG
jgi:phosphonate transport system substrate-binding protein